MVSITDKINEIEERIQKACNSSGRKRQEIALLGVTKFQKLSCLQEAWDAGIRLFGESRVKEGIQKFSDFRSMHEQACVHLIGSLQRNKAKIAAGFFDCIQSVDRMELIEELGKCAGLGNKKLSILLELHTGESTKNGFPCIDSLFKAAEYAMSFNNLHLCGLMTMAPFTAEKNEIRTSFRLLCKARDALEKDYPGGSLYSWNCLSMGMSHDFEIAIEEGSTMLRIGNAIFGDG
jgi:pyridoxal phosphate enzyme (YggS family)